MASLIGKLSKSLGARQAAIEINWMRQAAPHALEQMVNRRVQGEPLQYILGSQPFGPLDVLVRPPTLIPRPETEQWTSELATRIRGRMAHQGPLRVLDLCTGSGCIPLLLCHLLHVNGSAPPTHMATLGVDISAAACQLAHDNLLSCGIPPDFSLDFRQKNIFDKDLWDFIKKAFRELRPHRCDALGKGAAFQLDVITANPPYIPRAEWLRLPPEVKNWEDPLALLGDFCETAELSGNKGLTFYERIRDLLTFPDILSPQGILAMEVGEGQAGDVAKMFHNRLGQVEVWKDLWGKERAVFIHGKVSC